jgi:hypothetical protein
MIAIATMHSSTTTNYGTRTGYCTSTVRWRRADIISNAITKELVLLPGHFLLDDMKRYQTPVQPTK